MHPKPLIWIGIFVGSTVGGMFPSLWGAGMFSYSLLCLGTAGALLGLWLGFRLSV